MDASSLVASFAVSSIGYVAFSYGKRQRRAPPLAAGLLLMLFPYFVDSVPVMLTIATGLVLAMWLATRLGW